MIVSTAAECNNRLTTSSSADAVTAIHHDQSSFYYAVYVGVATLSLLTIVALASIVAVLVRSRRNARQRLAASVFHLQSSDIFRHLQGWKTWLFKEK